MNDLISVFIPTYNRCNVLDVVLDSVINAVKQYDICVHVYDNSSVDMTENIVLEKQKRYPHIIYNKNKTNVGLDNNMLNVLNEQSTKYTLMLGDDDILKTDFYVKIESYLKQCFDFIVLSTDLVFETTVFSDKLNAFSFLWDKMPYGTLIIRNGLINRHDVEKYIGTSHAYSAIPWESMLCSNADGKCLFYSYSKLVELGVVEKTWKSNAIDIYIYQIPLWFSLLPEVYSVNNKIFRKYMKNIFAPRNLYSLYKLYDFRRVSNTCFLSFAEKLKYSLVRKLQKVK